MEQYCHENNLPPTALLLIDNATCHPAQDVLMSADKKIVVMFLPPNVTSVLQPMDQNVLRLLKLHYRNKLLSQIISNGNVADSLKKIDLRQAIVLLNESWQQIKSETIAHCWKRILDEEDEVPLSQLRNTEATRCYEDIAQIEFENCAQENIQLLNNISAEVRSIH